jgi:hypothetical protein
MLKYKTLYNHSLIVRVELILNSVFQYAKVPSFHILIHLSILWSYISLTDAT